MQKLVFFRLEIEIQKSKVGECLQPTYGMDHSLSASNRLAGRVLEIVFYKFTEMG
jgi:hypothetical protein